jgi:tetratricopeptide (TPR) repeat protein
MALSYWGFDDGQFDIAPIVKPDPEDKHVGIHQMADYARVLGLNTLIRANGTLEGLKRLLNAGFPVIIRSWYVRDARDQLGHYRLVIGYDDGAQHFDLYDSLYDPPTTMPYTELYELWRVVNWTYMVIAPPERWDEVTALIGPDLDDVAMYERALARAQGEADALPETCVAYADCADWVTFAWFTMGTNLAALGRHEEAAAAYDQARQLGLHYRMLWYQFGPYESYFAVERYEDVIALADATLATANNLEESYLWRGRARQALGDRPGAERDYQTALKYHEGWQPALDALANLESGD